MTITIDLPEDVFRRLTAEAEAEQETVDEVVKRLLSRTTEKPKKVLQGRGMLKGVGMTVDEFLAEKHEETMREEEVLGWR